MTTEIRYRGREYGEEEIAFIRKLIADNPGANRKKLSLKLCAAWNWVQANGASRDMVCRSFLIRLHKAGLIELPAPQRPPPAPRRSRASMFPLLRFEPIETKLCELLPLGIRQVRRRGGEDLFQHLLERYHYLGYTQPVGEHLKHLVMARSGQPVACAAWSSAPRHIGCRDRYIGWSQEARKRNIHLMAYNTRFLILPWVKVPHLASHILGRLVKRISPDWQELYSHPIYFLETFVDTERFKGTCYRAANWIHLGRTTGRGKNDLTKKQNRSIKDVLGYPLMPDFRERLCQG